MFSDYYSMSRPPLPNTSYQRLHTYPKVPIPKHQHKDCKPTPRSQLPATNKSIQKLHTYQQAPTPQHKHSKTANLCQGPTPLENHSESIRDYMPMSKPLLPQKSIQRLQTYVTSPIPHTIALSTSHHPKILQKFYIQFLTVIKPKFERNQNCTFSYTHRRANRTKNITQLAELIIKTCLINGLWKSIFKKKNSTPLNEQNKTLN